MPGAGVTGFVPQQFKPHIHSVQRAAQLMSQARNQRPQPGQPIRRIERGLEFFDGREIPEHNQQPGRYSLAAQAEERNQEGAARRQRQRHVVRFGARGGGLDQCVQRMVRTQHRGHRWRLRALRSWAASRSCASLLANSTTRLASSSTTASWIERTTSNRCV